MLYIQQKGQNKMEGRKSILMIFIVKVDFLEINQNNITTYFLKD